MGTSLDIEKSDAEEMTGEEHPTSARRRHASHNVNQTERIGSTIAGSALAAYGMRHRGPVGYTIASLGAWLLHRGVTGRCLVYRSLGVSTENGRLAVAERTDTRVHPSRAINARAAITIARPREELFRMWRDFAQLPRFIDHLERVDVLSPTRSHWVVSAPAGLAVEWDAEIIEEQENAYILWEAVEPTQIPNRGSIHFSDAPRGRGTEVLVTLNAEIPAGRVGNAVARLFGKSPEREVALSLRRFKQIAETGHVPTTEGQPSGRDALERAAGNGKPHPSSTV